MAWNFSFLLCTSLYVAFERRKGALVAMESVTAAIESAVGISGVGGITVATALVRVGAVNLSTSSRCCI